MVYGSEIGSFTKQIDSLTPIPPVSSIIYEGAGLSGGKFFASNSIWIRGLSPSSLDSIGLTNSKDNSTFLY